MSCKRSRSINGDVVSVAAMLDDATFQEVSSTPAKPRSGLKLFSEGGILKSIDSAGTVLEVQSGSSVADTLQASYDVSAAPHITGDVTVQGAVASTSLDSGSLNISNSFPTLILKNTTASGAQISMRNSSNQVDATVGFLFDNLTLQNTIGGEVQLLTSGFNGLAVTNSEIKPHQDAIAIGTVGSPFTDLHLSGQADIATLSVLNDGVIGGSLSVSGQDVGVTLTNQSADISDNAGEITLMKGKTVNQNATPGVTNFNGVVTSNSAPSAATDLCNRTYVDTKVNKGGDTLTGILSTGTFPIMSFRTPVGPEELTRKQYVDDEISGASSALQSQITTVLGRTDNISATSGTSSFTGRIVASTEVVAPVVNATTTLLVKSKDVGNTLVNMTAIAGTTSLVGGLAVGSVNTANVYINAAIATNTINPRTPGSSVSVTSSLTVNEHVLKNTAGNAGKTLDLKQIESIDLFPGIPGVTLPPSMNSNTFTDGSGTWISSASSFWSGAGGFGGPAYHAFTNSTSTLWYSNNTIPNSYNQTTGLYTANTFSTNGYFGEWIQIAFPVAQTISSYRITQYGTTQVQGVIPTQFKIFSSDDGSTWTERDDRNITWDIPNNERFRDFTLSSEASGRYWRLACNVVGQPSGAAFRGLCQIAGLSYSTTGIDPICPAGCLRINNETHIIGDLHTATNAEIGGVLDVGGDLDVSGNITKSYALANFSANPTQTPIPTAGTYFPILGTTQVLGQQLNSSDFTVDYPSNIPTITYTGVPTKMFQISASIIGILGSSSPNVIEFRLYKNGSQYPPSCVRTFMDSNSLDPGESTMNTLIELSTGDLLNIWVTNLSDPVGVIVNCLSFVATQI